MKKTLCVNIEISRRIEEKKRTNYRITMKGGTIDKKVQEFKRYQDAVKTVTCKLIYIIKQHTLKVWKTTN